MHRISGPPAAPFASGQRGEPQRWLWLAALLCGLAGVFWLRVVAVPPTIIATQPTLVATTPLPVGVASMDSPAFRFSPGWRVDRGGADPAEPTAPWQEPAGTVEFEFAGEQLWLLLAAGDYWGYLYVTINEKPANRLPVIAGNVNSQGEPAGYRTLYAPARPGEQWLHVYTSAPATRQVHRARIEVWRSWGQTPLRAVAVQASTKILWPHWPGFLLVVVAFWSMIFAGWRPLAGLTSVRERLAPRRLAWLRLEQSSFRLAIIGLLVLVAGIALNQWLPVVAGLALLGLAALVRPAVWIAALLFGLPFYYQFSLPILPWRSLSLIDVGILGGLALMALHWLVSGHHARRTQQHPAPSAKSRTLGLQSAILWALISWSLISALAADQRAVALREWRVVFLAAGLFALLLHWSFQSTTSRKTDEPLLIAGWIAGGTAVALVALWQYATGTALITAEGVWRVRAFYGSPNNLALYLERTLAVSLGLALFAPTVPARWRWGALSAVQGLALLLTFSKGALLLGLPALLAILWLGGLAVLVQQGRSRRPLWWIAGLAVLVLLAMLPFLATERFQRLLDFSQGTGFLRLNLWRSAWQMALDHPLLGVGPDNFLYAYRSSYILPAAWQEPNLNHPHNWVLDWWTRLGLPGLALAVAFFALIFMRLWQGLRQAERAPLYLGVLAAAGAGLAHGLIDASYALPDLMLVWVLIASMADLENNR